MKPIAAGVDEGGGEIMNYVWIVEMLDNGKWKPTIGVGLTKIHGQWQRREWRRRNPDDKFRLRKYATNRSK